MSSLLPPQRPPPKSGTCLHGTSVKSAIFSGNCNQLHDDVSGTHFRFKDTPVIASEAGFLVQPTASLEAKTYPGSYKFGSTIPPIFQYRHREEMQNELPRLLRGESEDLPPQSGDDRGIDVNFVFDWAPSDITKNFSQVTGSVRYHCLIPRRDRDTISVGIVYSHISGVLNHALSDAGLVPFGTEKALELNYAMKLTSWLTFQPLLQYCFDIGAEPHSRNSMIAGFRTTFVL